MSRKDWSQIAKKQFKSLSRDIQDDWADLHQLTSKRA
jgi:hypothetical protein